MRDQDTIYADVESFNKIYKTRVAAADKQPVQSSIVLVYLKIIAILTIVDLILNSQSLIQPLLMKQVIDFIKKVPSEDE